MEFSYTNARYNLKNENKNSYNLHGTTINSPDFKKSAATQKSSKSDENNNFPLVRLLVTTLSLVIIITISKVFPISESKTKKLSQIEQNLMTKTKQFIDAHYNKPKYKRKLVILLGEDHAFQDDISELFNMRNDTVFIEQPLWQMQPWRPWLQPDITVNGLAMNLLHDALFNCRLSDPKTLPVPEKRNLNPEQPVSNKHYPHEWGACKLDGVCHREKMKILNENPLCQKDKNNKFCNPRKLDTQKFHQECIKRNITVVKLARVCDLLDLEHFLETSLYQASDNLSINEIHVVLQTRDPRSIVNERLKQNFTEQELLHFDACECSLKSVMWCRTDGPYKILPGTDIKLRVFPVTYEEFAEEPKEYLHKILQFVGVGLNPEQEKWISLKPNRIEADNNRWEEELSSEMIEHIESSQSCAAFIKHQRYHERSAFRRMNKKLQKLK